MTWRQILAVLLPLAAGTLGVVLMDLGNLAQPELCNGWFCIGAAKTFHVGIYMTTAGLWVLGTLLLWVWSHE